MYKKIHPLGMLNWREILEALAIHGGRAGLTKEAFTELLAKLYPGWNAVKVWDRLAKMTDCSLTDSGLLQVKSDVWEKIMSEGRAIKLSESALNILETIGMAGEAGIGCPDLSKKLKIDARNLHYHLNPLQQHGIIHKIPIALNKTNTSLCVLGRFVAEEDAGEGLGTSVIPGSRFRCTRAEMKEKITQILGSLPESRLTCRDIMRQLVTISMAMGVFYSAV